MSNFPALALFAVYYTVLMTTMLVLIKRKDLYYRIYNQFPKLAHYLKRRSPSSIFVLLVTSAPAIILSLPGNAFSWDWSVGLFLGLVVPLLCIGIFVILEYQAAVAAYRFVFAQQEALQELLKAQKERPPGYRQPQIISNAFASTGQELLMQEALQLHGGDDYAVISSKYFGETMSAFDFYNRAAMELKIKVMYDPKLRVNGPIVALTEEVISRGGALLYFL